jgi:hypothetical protein
MSRSTGFDDLRHFIDAAAPFATVTLPTPSQLDDAQHRFEIQWKNARRELEAAGWAMDDLAEFDAAVAELPHDGGAGLVLFRSADATTFAEFIDEPVGESVIAGSALPRLAVVIESRQRAVAHLVVEIDRAGADIHTFDGGRVLGTAQVEGDTEHIHRGHPGGWSQRRFQQRAENTWERNAGDVADQIVHVAGTHHAEMIFVAGDTRAQHLLLDALPERERERTNLVEAGSPEGIADEIVRLLADHVARAARELIGAVKTRAGTGTASTDVADILAGLAEGRVEHLLVHDDGTDDAVTTQPIGDVPTGARIVDAAIAAALRTDADVTVIPRVAMLEGPVAALYRW